MMPNPGSLSTACVEKPVRVSSTALVHFQRNRYSVPTDHAHRVISLRIYPDALQFIADGEEIARYAGASSVTRPSTTSGTTSA